MPKLGLGLSLPQTRITSSAPVIPTDGLSLWLKADAGVTLATSGPYTYVSQIVITGSNTPNVNGTYNASSVPTFDFEGMPNQYFLIGPTYAIEWTNPTFYLDVSEISAGASWTSSNGTSWTILESRPDTITISGSETPNVNGVYTNPDFGNVFYGPTTNVIEKFTNFELLDQATSTTYYTASSATGPWTIVDGSGEITSTITLAPRGSITATKVVSSSAVTAWADQSGNARNASPVDVNPTYNSSDLNSKPTISLSSVADATNKSLQISGNPMGASGSTAFVVNYVDPNVFGSDANGALLGNFGSAENGSHWPYGLSDPASVYDSFATDTRKDDLGLPGGITNWNIYSVYSEDDDYKLFCNGIQFHSDASNVYSNAIANSTSLYIGMQNNAGTDQIFKGKVAEVVIYNRVLTTPERQQVEQYLNSKYQIYPWRIVISGAGTTSSNGEYVWDGSRVVNGKPIYDKVGGTFDEEYIIWESEPNNFWSLYDSVAGSTYNSQDLITWNEGPDGSSPVPTSTLSYSPNSFISSITLQGADLSVVNGVYTRTQGGTSQFNHASEVGYAIKWGGFNGLEGNFWFAVSSDSNLYKSSDLFLWEDYDESGPPSVSAVVYSA